ncbi:MAG TPA: alpha/beta hydrolase [Trebonia sp.]|nr:alpha/beta hydrolase [Trebonia sp.]
MSREGQVMSGGHLVPHWPGRLIDLPGGDRVYVASTSDPPEGRAATRHSPGPEGNGVERNKAGEPVLCVHGMAGSATNWTDFMAQIAGAFDCDAIDLPGSGWSPPPATVAGYAIGPLASIVTRLIEHQGRGPVHLVGNSMGGLISVRVAATRPDLVRSLTLISPALPDRLIRPSVVRFPLLGLPKVGEWLLGRADVFPAEPRVRMAMSAIFHDAAAVNPQRFREAVAEMERRVALGYANESLAGAARAITAEYLRPARSAANAWRLARAVSCPVLAIYGSHDRLVNPKMAGRAAREFTDCHVIVLPSTGHVAQMEHPSRVAAEFREFARAAGRSRPVAA